tara:strand:+ start:130 stop:348 length:219 start_codon:yes stop_codon:yes gene_type:complete
MDLKCPLSRRRKESINFLALISATTRVIFNKTQVTVKIDILRYFQVNDIGMLQAYFYQTIIMKMFKDRYSKK